jgi:hypothetical protein
MLNNPLDKIVTFRVDNDNPTAFHLVAKRVLQFAAREKRRIEVRYIPTTLGTKELATLTFRSNEVGDWIFHLSGIGKPPQTMSPVVVSAPVDVTNSGLVVFANPFYYPSRFSICLTSDQSPDLFRLLIRRRNFTVQSFGEEFHIPFTFTPRSSGQYLGNIVVASLGPARGPPPDPSVLPAIHWIFPIVGSCVASGKIETKFVGCRAHESYEDEFMFSLIGEREIFEPRDYVVSLTFPAGYDFVHTVLEARPSTLRRQEGGVDLFVVVRLRPQRPLNITGQVSVKSPVGQEWNFELAIAVEPGKPVGSIVVESLLQKTGTARVYIPNVLRATAPFHAYFVQGSATEFTVSPQNGFLELPPVPGSETIELPITVVFAPKMYGKVLKGILAVDTVECQFLFDVCGKTPDYVRPVVKKGTAVVRLENLLSPEDAERMQTKKRNVIKENIEAARIAKPVVSPQRARK